MFGVGCWGNDQSRGLEVLAQGVPSSPTPPGSKTEKEKTKGQGQYSQARRRNRAQAQGEQTPLLRTWGHKASQGGAAPGAKCRAKGGAPLPTSGQGSGSVLSRGGRGSSPPLPASRFDSLFSLSFPVLVAKPSTVNRKPGDASGATEIPAAPQTLALPGSQPGVHQMLLLLGLHGAPHAPRWVREGARPPCPERPGSCARDAAQRAPTCPVGPARRSPRPCARASRPPAALRGNSRPGHAGGRPAAAPAAPAAPACPLPQLRPAPARFILPRPPRVKPLAARRVQKPAGKGEGRPAAQGFPALPPST